MESQDGPTGNGIVATETEVIVIIVYRSAVFIMKKKMTELLINL